MKTYLCFLLTTLLLTSCSSGEPRYTAQFMHGKESIGATLRYESFFNPDGLEKRKVSLEYPGSKTLEFEAHSAHYSDAVILKKLEAHGREFLIAEDSTGYTVWDLNSRKVIKERGVGESGTLSETGTGRDYMTHAALNKGQWAKLLGLRPGKEVTLTSLEWQQ